MPLDPFSSVVQNWAELAPRLAVDAFDEQEVLPTILQEVRNFCEEKVDGEHIDATGKLGSDLLAEVADRGWFALTIPEQHGGVGLSMAAATRVVTELAAHNGSLGTCIGLHSGLALHALIHAAEPSVQEHYLPEIASGQRIAAFAATEPNAGSDISAVRTTLTEVDGRLILNGSKCFVTNGGVCGALTVLARSPGLGGARAGHTLVFVDPQWQGVSRSAEEHKLGLKGSSTISIDFEDVEVPVKHVLGEVSRGLEQAHAALCWGRTFMAAGCLGSAQGALATAREHVHARQQFGRPLFAFPLVRQAIAEATAEVYAIESALRLVYALSDTKVADITVPSSMVKILASNGAWDVADTALQLMGGTGYMEESGIPRRLRDLRVTRIFEGANDVLRVSLASSALVWSMKSLREIRVPGNMPAALQSEVQHFDHSSQALADGIQQLKKKWGFRLFEQQARAAALADAMTALFTAMAVMMRAQAEGSERLAISRLALRRHLKAMDQSIQRAVDPEDPELTQLTEAVAAIDS